MYSKHAGKPRGMSVGHTWQGAIKRNGNKPTIYPHVATPGHIKGFMSKSDCLGMWSKSHGGRDRY